jgi:ATP-dependent Clp protease adaptor protein ClpS
MSQHDPQVEEITGSQTDSEVKEPPMFKVLLLNDDYTTMEFVVEVLMHVFHKALEEATRIMLNVHRRGVGVCGVYPYEIAQTKVETVETLARENGFPLKCTMERE